MTIRRRKGLQHDPRPNPPRHQFAALRRQRFHRLAKPFGPRTIHFAPGGGVEIRKNLARSTVDPKATVAKIEAKKPKQRPAISKATLRYANALKTLATQMTLMENPRKAKEATAILLLGSSKRATIQLKAHEALRELARHPGSSNAYELIDTCARRRPRGLACLAPAANWQPVISGIRSLNGIELDALIALLVILCFGIERMEGQEPQETFFSGRAKGRWWLPACTSLAAAPATV